MTDYQPLLAEAKEACEGSPIFDQLAALDLQEMERRQGWLAAIRIHPKWLYRLQAEPRLYEQAKFLYFSAERLTVPLVSRMSGKPIEVTADRSVGYIVATVAWLTWQGGAQVEETAERELSEVPDIAARSLVPRLADALREAQSEIEHLKEWGDTDSYDWPGGIIRILGDFHDEEECRGVDDLIAEVARLVSVVRAERDVAVDALREMGAERDQLFKLSLHFERALHHIAVTLSSLDAIQAYAQIALADAVLGAVSGTEGGET